MHRFRILSGVLCKEIAGATIRVRTCTIRRKKLVKKFCDVTFGLLIITVKMKPSPVTLQTSYEKLPSSRVLVIWHIARASTVQSCI